MRTKHERQGGAGRIVFVNRFFHPDHSATSQLLSDLAFGLAERGLEIVVVTSRLSYDDPLARFPARERINGVDVRRVWTSCFGRGKLAQRAIDYLTFYVSTLLVLLSMCRRDDVLISETDPPMLGVITGLVGGVRGCATVNWLQDVFPEIAAELGMLRRSGFVFRLLRRVRDWSLRRADVNVVLGERMAEFIAGRGVDPDSIVVIPNWADGTLIKPLEAEVNPLRKEWGLSGKFVVGYSGNLGRAHDYETILEAADRLRDDERVAFLVIGGGAKYELFRRAVIERGLRNVVFKLYQPREALAQTLTLPDMHLVSLLPELEGLMVPSKVYGVMAAGRAVVFIGDARSDLAKMIAKGRFGWRVAPSASGQLIGIVRVALTDIRGTSNLGRAARSEFEANYGYAIACGRWVDLINDLGTALGALDPRSARVGS